MHDEVLEKVHDARVVIMCGVSGSGKTFFSRRLEQLGFRRISSDGIVWDKYGSDFTHFPPSRQKEIFMSAQHDLAEQMVSLIDAGDKVVVDSTMCRRSKRNHMRALCLSKGINPAIVYMSAPLHILQERLSNRKDTGPDDQRVDDDNLKQYYTNFETPSADENALVCSPIIHDQSKLTN